MVQLASLAGVSGTHPTKALGGLVLVSDRSGWSLDVVPSVALPGRGDLVLGVVPLVTVLNRGELLVRMIPSVAVRSVAPYPAPMCGRRCRH